MSIVTEVHPDYQQLEGWVDSLPHRFNEGELLYHSRNEVRLFETGGLKMVVKRFKRHNLLKRIIYSFFRQNKAQRAFQNAAQLRMRGFATPHEIAYIEECCCGTLSQVYYICNYTDAQAIRPCLIGQKPFDRNLAVAYARFVARLHEAGVLHRDLNPTNVLFTEHDGQFSFELIDINRMRFYDGPVPKAECMENLTLFWWLSPVYRFILNEYASQRGWTEADIAKAITVKQQHDKAWVRRKRITHPFRKTE
ncbi:MAG: hypothetical protein J5486_10825 [Bacteroidaceae bacterium]|nr:hypothetical protein [Bacteroidaceae bacterium]